MRRSLAVGAARRGLIAALLLALQVLPSPAVDCQDYSRGLRWLAGLDFNTNSDSDIAFSGDYAYVAMNKIKVLDIADPAQPLLLGEASSTFIHPRRIDVAGNHLVATYGASPIEIYSLADPASPQLVNSWQPPAAVSDVAVVGNICYLACSGIGVLVLYIADPLNPVSYGSVGGTSCSRVHYLAGHLYTCATVTGGAGLIVYSIDDALHPAETFRWGTAVVDPVPSGTRLYVAMGASGIALFGLATPGTPTLIGSMDTPGFPTSAIGFGNYFFTLESSASRIICYDDAGPTPWPAIGELSTAFSPDMIKLHADHAFVPSSSHLEVFDLSEPTGGPELLGYWEDLVNTSMFSVAAQGGYAYVSNVNSTTFHGRVEVIDIQNPASPQRVRTVPFGNFFPADFAIGEQLLYVADGADVAVIDIAVPAQADHVGHLDTPGIAKQVELLGDLLLIADGPSGLQVASLAPDPTQPQLLGGLDFAPEAYALAGMGQYALVLLSGGTLKVIDLIDPAAPVDVGSLTLTAFMHAERIAVQGNYAYVDGDAEIFVVDLAQPSAPQIVSGAAVSGSALDLVAVGETLYVASSTAGLQVIDIGEPEQPRLIGALPMSYLSDGIAVDGEVVCVASEIRLNLAPRDCLTLTPIAEETPAPAALGLSAHPNPFNPATRIRFTLPEPRRVDLALIDVGGRRVRSLLAGAFRPAGEFALDWDGRSDAGVPLPSGVYLLRLEAGELRGAAKLTLLR